MLVARRFELVTDVPVMRGNSGIGPLGRRAADHGYCPEVFEALSAASPANDDRHGFCAFRDGDFDSDLIAQQDRETANFWRECPQELHLEPLLGSPFGRAVK